jgi:rRNA-processing protein FCF1
MGNWSAIKEMHQENHRRREENERILNERFEEITEDDVLKELEIIRNEEKRLVSRNEALNKVKRKIIQEEKYNEEIRYLKETGKYDEVLNK